MRLGGFFGADSIAELEALCEKLDCYGLSAISAPANLAKLSDEECVAFGNRANKLNIVKRYNFVAKRYKDPFCILLRTITLQQPKMRVSMLATQLNTSLFVTAMWMQMIMVFVFSILP